MPTFRMIDQAIVKKNTYKPGFEEVPVLRGADKIKYLWELLETNLPYSTLAWSFCGGFVRWMCSPRETPVPPSDIDIYCTAIHVFDDIEKVLVKNGLSKFQESSIAISLKLKKEGTEDIIQLIKPINEGKVVSIGEMETIISNFDFTVVRCGLIDLETALVDANFLHDEEKLYLRIQNVHCPISSTYRFAKYIKKGYYAPLTEIVKLFLDWDRRSSEYRTGLLATIAKMEEEGLTKHEIDNLEALMRLD